MGDKRVVHSDQMTVETLAGNWEKRKGVRRVASKVASLVLMMAAMMVLD